MGAAVLPCDSIAPWVDRADAAGDEGVCGVPDSVLADLISRGAEDDAPLGRHALGHLDEPVGVVHCRRELGRRDLDGDRVGVEVRLRLRLRARAGASVRVGVGVGLGIGLELGRRDLDGAHRVHHEASPNPNPNPGPNPSLLTLTAPIGSTTRLALTLAYLP